MTEDGCPTSSGLKVELMFVALRYVVIIDNNYIYGGITVGRVERRRRGVEILLRASPPTMNMISGCHWRRPHFNHNHYGL